MTGANAPVPHLDPEAGGIAQGALSGAGPRPAMLLLTLASVQNFVATARRTQDLWLGSFLFSYLMYRAMEGLYQEAGYDPFLLPTLQGQPLFRKRCAVPSMAPPSPEELLVANLPNVFTAVVPADRGQILACAAESGLHRARDEVFGQVKTSLEVAVSDLGSDANWDSAWTRQRENFLTSNLHWVVVPWVQGEDYAKAAPRAARLLGARKILRQFAPVEEPGEKCTLCGLRSALHPTSVKSYSGLRQFWDERLATVGQDRADDVAVKLAGRIRRGERLCAVCLTKRLALQCYFTPRYGLDYHLFPSTATVAVSGFLVRTLERAHGDSGFAEKLDAFVDRAKKVLGKHRRDLRSSAPPLVESLARFREDPRVRLDGQWFMPEAWSTAALRSEFGVDPGQPIDDEPVRGVRAALGELLEDVVGAGPGAYFAIVVADGDKLGERLAGSGSAVSPEYHADLALRMRNFSLQLARRVVEEAVPGKLLYAGGDDLLALVPLESVLRVLRLIRAVFRGALPAGTTGADLGVGDWSFDDGRVAGPKMTTPVSVLGLSADLSAAVVLAHHSHPLAHAVEEAQHALKHHAKDALDRSAVAFRVLKRAGERVITGLKWESVSGSDLVGLLGEVSDDIANGRLSPSLGHDMLRERRSGVAMDFAFEADRLDFLLSRRPDGVGVKEAAGRARELLKSLQDLASQWSRNPDVPWKQAAELFDLARFLAARGGR